MREFPEPDLPEVTPPNMESLRLVVPGNERLDGAAAVVWDVTPWGAHVRTQAAATGQFRAISSEMVPYAEVNGKERARVMAKDEGYTGDLCDCCGSARMRQLELPWG